ncbi:Ig-like domain-containing protein [Marinobacter sp.]|uniref:Ig-like domain-containing protein n=2 Tax=unclassified Marinobacter TaxID=83889 RepID=UPI001B4F2697|nr:Ig-like domain-containing protein [Marinobacter sp.]MBQ0831198.1 Ig-like domain-containing protein [Marinobacter sp.]
MSGKFFARASALSLAFMLAACGGDDDSTPLAGNGNNNGSGGGTEEPTNPSVNIGSVQLLASTPAMGSSGQDKAIITALVRDQNGILTPDVGVNFEASNNGSLIVTAPTTSKSGQASAELSTQGDARNRTISVTASANSISGSVNVDVTGTTMNLTGPSAISNGASANFEARLLDSAGQGISNTVVSISSQNNTVSTTSVSTDSAGRVQFLLDAQAGGLDTLSVAAYEGESRISAQLDVNISADNFVFDGTDAIELEVGSSKEISVRWNQNGSPVVGQSVRFVSTRGTLSANDVLTNAQGIATASISSNDVGIAEITASAESSEGSQIEATKSIEFVSSSPQTITMRASKTQVSTNGEASIITTVKDANGNLVKNAAVEFSLIDSTGGTLLPGSVKTDSQGRAISTYKSTSSISEKDGVQVTATITRKDGTSESKSLFLTVAGRALTLILGTGNTISAPSETTYDMPWSVLVTDANGNASANQSVQLSILPLEFTKGSYVWAEKKWEIDPTETCQTNHADANNGTEIANPASAPNSVVTDAVGSIEFNIRYPKGECSWVKVRLTATSNVEGFSSSNTREFTLPCLADDLSDEGVSPPGGNGSPYNGTACN